MYAYPELCSSPKNLEIYSMDQIFSDLLYGKSNEYILVMSHNLDFNGAALALFYAARILHKNGYRILFVSWNDGELKSYLMKEGIPVIVDSNLELKRSKDIAWISAFDKFICNTLNYYQFLSERRLTDKVIWWLHDPLIFYETVNKDILGEIDSCNLKIFAAGSIAENAMRQYRSDLVVHQLVYGIPDYNFHNRKSENKRLELVIIGTIQEYKGQDILVRAMMELSSAEQSMLHVRIVGHQDSVFADNVKRMASKLYGEVEFIPPIGRQEIHNILDTVDVFVCPSRVDTMSIASTEAMQHAIPCIVSNSVGIATYIQDGVDGIVFNCGDASELALKIKWCLQNKNSLNNMGKLSRKIYEKYFSMEIFEDNLLSIVDDFFN